MSEPRALLRVDLGDNVVLTWALKKARREPRTFVIALCYLGALYGIPALVSFFTRPIGAKQWSELFSVFHYLAWTANAFLFLLAVPVSFAQTLAVERERRTFDHLRMTATSGFTLVQGNVAAAYALPLMLALLSIPHAVAGCFSDRTGGSQGVYTAYGGLAACSLCVTALSGVLAFVPKRASRAGGVAIGVNVVVGIVAFAASNIPGFEILGCFGPAVGLAMPWKAGPQEVPFLGSTVPALLVQVPLNVVVALVFLRAVARKIEDESGSLLGPSESVALGGVLGALAVATYLPHPEFASSFRRHQEIVAELAAGRFIFLVLLLLPLAADGATSYEDLVRGLARSPLEPKRRNEQLRLAPSLVLAGVILVGAAIGMSLSLGNGERKIALLVAGVASASYVLVAILGFQAAKLVAPFRQPNIIAGAALAFLWIAPVIASRTIELSAASFRITMPDLVIELPTVLSPFVTVFLAARAIKPDTTVASVDPLSLALVATFLNGLIGLGLYTIVRRAHARAAEFASTLVALPADTFAAAGEVERRCERGHVYSAKWDRCPHCPGA